MLLDLMAVATLHLPFEKLLHTTVKDLADLSRLKTKILACPNVKDLMMSLGHLA